MKYPIYKIRNNIYHYSSALRRFMYRKIYGMNIGSNTRISRHAKLDRTNPKGIHIGMDSQITFGVVILTHDFINRKQVNTYVGDCVFLGGNSIILPGVRVGNHCIIGTGSVVTKDIPDNSIAVGNPARVIKTGIATGEYGILINDETDEKLPSESQLYEQFD